MDKETWKGYFVKLLEGSETVKLGKDRQQCEEEEEKEKEKITAEEIEKAWSILKKRKAAGPDGIPNEVWLYGGRDLINKLVCIIGKVWDGQGLPEDWKTGVIVPLYKKGNPNEAKNYRGITLMSTAYKLYTEVIRKRLVEEVEEKGILPEGQAGFRKGRSTLDNIYVLNHIIQKGKVKGLKTYASFVDLKAAFDTVDRELLWEIMEKVGISKYIIERIKEIYQETRVRVRVEGDFSEEFWTVKGLKQGCVLSPILFCIYIAGLEEDCKKRNVGGVKIGEKRLWSLAYADDLVLLAENREALVDMLDTLKKFLKSRKMILSEEKTKVLVFNRGRRSKKERWIWEGKELEEVRCFKYLGFTFNREGNYKDHIKDVQKKGMTAAKRTWGLGENRCKNDFARRRMLFSYLVRSVMEYGCEIWGWKERKELEKIQMDYYRWILRLDFNTPRHIMYEEIKVDKMKIGWGSRAVKYEEKIRTLDDSRLTKMCWKEVTTDAVQSQSLYTKERKEFYNSLGLSEAEVENMRAAEKEIYEETEAREKDIARQINLGKIRESKYNEEYRKLVVDKVPVYLRKHRRGIEIDIIAKIRCGNLERANRYWLKEEDRSCRICKKERETFEHIILECEDAKTMMDTLSKEGGLRRWKLVNEVGSVDVVKAFKKFIKEAEKKSGARANKA